MDAIAQRPEFVIRIDFDSFYRAEVAQQVRRAALLVGSDDAANDIVHEALANMYRRWEQIEEPAPYLNRAVLNGCRDRARKAKHHRGLIDRLRPRASTQGEPEIVTDLLARLPFNQRSAVVLRFYGGWSTAEIADALGCPPGSVGPWIDRALMTLRRELL